MAAGRPSPSPSQRFLVRSKVNRIGRAPSYELEVIGDGELPGISQRLRPALSEHEEVQRRKGLVAAIELIEDIASRGAASERPGRIDLVSALADGIWTLVHIGDLTAEEKLALQDAIGALVGVWPNELLTRDELLERLV